MRSTSADFTSKAIVALIACHVAGLIFLPAMPMVMGAFVNDFAASSEWLGRIASLQLMATACGAFCFSVLGRRSNCRLLVILALACEILINIATINAGGVVSLLILRGFSGFFQGTLLAAAGAGATLSKCTEKTFALYNIALAVFAVVVLICGATVVPQYGNAGVFGIIICVDMLALGVVIRQFPTFRLIRKEDNSPPLGIRAIPGAFRVLLALGLFGIGLSGTQTFMERLGFYHGTTLDVMAIALALGWCLAVFSPFILLWNRHTQRRISGVLLVSYAGIAILGADVILCANFLRVFNGYGLIYASDHVYRAITVWSAWQTRWFGTISGIGTGGHFHRLWCRAVSYKHHGQPVFPSRRRPLCLRTFLTVLSVVVSC